MYDYELCRELKSQSIVMLSRKEAFAKPSSKLMPLGTNHQRIELNGSIGIVCALCLLSLILPFHNMNKCQLTYRHNNS